MKEIIKQENFTDFILYNSPEWDIRVEVFLKDENLWLTQDKISKIFWVDRTVINKHLKNIYETAELKEESTCAKITQVQIEWNREVKREIKYYNLDAIIAVWYRVNSLKATNFRIWSNKILKDFIIKWFAMDDERLKNGKHFWKDYFKELLERIRSIRASERRIYLQITDIFAECAIDYDKNSEITKNFYAMIQNKFHFAITGNTAAEIIYKNADKNQENMWLRTWKNSPDWRILKSDVIVAKNYLTEKEIKSLERLVSSYFDYIELQIERKNTFTMQELADSINKFLDFNDYKILEDKWKISKKQAEEKAINEYDEFNKNQKIISDFEKFLKLKK